MKSTANIPECPNCDTTKRVTLRRGRFETTYNKIPITLDDAEMYICEECNTEIFTREQERSASQRVLEIARQKLGILSPEQVVTIRKGLDISQEDMEDLLGLGEKVVTRWETGRVVPGKTTDILLRLLGRRPELIHDLRTIRQEVLTQ
jgi:putative zinc finger/helix-turn-helix YgiT family protein